MASLELVLFGGFAARLASGEAIALPGRKAQLLLAYLAVRAGEPQTREKLIGLLWSDRGDAQARGSLRQELTVLRKALSAAEPSPIVIDGERLSLDAAAVAVDVRRFEELVQSEATADLERAAELYKGPFLDGLAVRDSACEEWLQHERERLRLVVLGVLDRLQARRMKEGAAARAIEIAETILAHDPLREDTHRTLMTLHASQGRHGLALRQYRICKELLARELAVEPEPETVRLYEQIQAQRSAPAAETDVAGPAAASAPQLAMQPAAAPGRPSIAVLPFVNISGDPDQEYFADGLTEDVITDLSRISALFVVAQHAVLPFKGRGVEVRQAARELNVGYVLEGSVRKAGARVRITAQLVDGSSGGHLWANRYDRDFADIFALQDEISQSIVDALKVKLLPGELAAIASRSTANAEAYQYYLMGRSFFLGSVWDSRALHVARQLFAKAIDIDPRYARAHAGVANCESHLLYLDDRTATIEAILASSGRALELEPSLAEAHAARGLALYMAGQQDAANAAFEEALRLGPDLFEAHFFHARNCRTQGQYERSAALFVRAAELHPGDFRSLGLAADVYRSLGRHEDAAAATRRCLERVEAEVAVHPDNAGALAFGAMILAEVGDATRAETWAARAGRLGPDDCVMNYNLACTYIELGRPDAALERLQRAFSPSSAVRRTQLEWMRHDSSIDPLRDHPGFRALVQRLESATEWSPPERIEAPDPAAGARPAVAVLPFANLSGDSGQQYFSDGITEDIITELSRWRQLTVLSRNSSFRYRDTPIDVTRVGRELGVDYVVEGSVRKAGNELRVTAQLVDTASGGHLWAERYDRNAEDIFAVQDDVVRTIVGTLVGRVQAAGAELAKRKPPASLAAYDCVLRGLALPWGDPQADAEARRLYEKAIALDPAYGLAHALLALMLYAEWGADTTGSDAALDRAFELAKRAVALDENESMCQFMLGLVLLMRRSFDLAEQYHRRAVEMNPNNPQHLADMGSLLVYLGRPDEGLEWLTKARRVDPYFAPAWYWHQLGFAHLTARRYDEAIKAFERSATLPYWVRGYIAACHAQLGRMAQAKEWAAQALRLKPDFSATRNALKEPFKHQRDLDHLLDALRKAGIPDAAPQPTPDSRGSGQVPPAAATDLRPALAVLPLQDLGGGEEYFSDGLTEDLITALASWRSFPVIARNSTFTYKGRTVDIKQVARELGARYVVEGSVRKDGGRVRVAVQLIDGATGHHLWANKYDRDLRDVFALQDELTHQLAAMIAPELERAEIKRASIKRPSDLDAWDCYLRGMALLAQFTPQGNADARALFERAAALDPGYADAFTGLAVSHNRDLLLQCATDRASCIESAMAAARRAVALDPSSAAAHSALATVHIWREEHDLSLAEARLAVELNPHDALTLHALGNKSDLAGDGEGIDRMVRAQALNPLDPERHSHLCFLARAYVNARRYDDAVACARAAIQRRPDYPPAHFILAVALGHLGRGAEARAALARCDELRPGFVAGRAGWRPYVSAASNDHLHEGLRKAGAGL
jgi:adenylate cyclase